MGKPWPHNIAINCLNLLVWASLCVLFILFFKPSFCNGPETELKWKTDIENQYNICILSYTDSWCLVHFSSNISCDHKHNVRLCCDYREKGRQISNSLVQSGVHSKQIVIRSKSKQVVTNRIPITAMHFRVNEASLGWNSSSMHFEWSGMVRRKWKESVV